MPAPVLRRSLALATALASALSIAACGSGTPGGANETRFIAGSGSVTTIPADRREDPIALSGPKVGGGDLDLNAYRGKVVLLNVWGSWCAPCRKEAEHLEAAWQDVQAKPVQFLGINIRDDAAGAAEAFERRFGITYPSFRDPNGTLLLVFRRTLPPKAIPSTLILDRQGRVAARIIGATTRATFVGLVSDVLAEPA